MFPNECAILYMFRRLAKGGHVLSG